MNKAQLATLLTVGSAVAFIGWAVVYLASFPGHPDKDDQLATRSQFRSWLRALRLIVLQRSMKSRMIFDRVRRGSRHGDAGRTGDQDRRVPLTAFELPPWLVEPAVRSCRLFNTAIDFIFYDVPTLRAALAEKDAPMQAQGEKPPSRIIDFDALSDPEGSLLLIDATTAPYVHKYQSVKKFLESPYQETRDVDIATITGVGSSALGSAALAWDISVALEKPVLAIVPGYGVADVVLQALGGWFAFGLYDFLSSKTLIQTGLAKAAPETARIGRELAASTPQEPTARGGAPIFRYGSGSSDVLHALLKLRVTPFRLLVGHSKGALQINNAIQSLPAERTRELRVVTLGCPIGENVEGVDYHQYLGLFDALGQLNSWGHWPEYWPPTWHSTNPVLPPAMAAGRMTSGVSAGLGLSSVRWGNRPASLWIAEDFGCCASG